MSLRQVNWDGFKTGGHDSRAKVSFKPPAKPDRRDNAQEIRISNAIASKIKSAKHNDALFGQLSEQQQQAILVALVST